MQNVNQDAIIDLGDAVAETKGSGGPVFDVNGLPQRIAGLSDD